MRGRRGCERGEGVICRGVREEFSEKAAVPQLGAPHRTLGSPWMHFWLSQLGLGEFVVSSGSADVLQCKRHGPPASITQPKMSTVLPGNPGKRKE